MTISHIFLNMQHMRVSESGSGYANAYPDPYPQDYRLSILFPPSIPNTYYHLTQIPPLQLGLQIRQLSAHSVNICPTAAAHCRILGRRIVLDAAASPRHDCQLSALFWRQPAAHLTAAPAHSTADGAWPPLIGPSSVILFLIGRDAAHGAWLIGRVSNKLRIATCNFLTGSRGWGALMLLLQAGQLLVVDVQNAAPRPRHFLFYFERPNSAIG